MIDARLDALAREYALPPSAAPAVAALLELLASDEHAPTPIRAAAEAVDVHIADALTGLHVPELRAAGTIADLGAGVGFPGLALAAALPDARVHLVESARRKGEWLRRAADAAGLANVEVVVARAEEWGDGRERCDVVTARALAALPVLVEYAAPLLRDGGVLVAWKGRPDAAEIRAGERAAELLGLRAEPAVAVTPYAAGGERVLVRYRKVGPTPAGFPRRAGMASKRPLGGAS